MSRQARTKIVRVICRRCDGSTRHTVTSLPPKVRGMLRRPATSEQGLGFLNPEENPEEKKEKRIYFQMQQVQPCAKNIFHLLNSNHECNQRAMTTVSNGAAPARAFLTGMAQAVRALDCPWSDMTRLVREAASCR